MIIIITHQRHSLSHYSNQIEEKECVSVYVLLVDACNRIHNNKCFEMCFSLWIHLHSKWLANDFPFACLGVRRRRRWSRSTKRWWWWERDDIECATCCDRGSRFCAQNIKINIDGRMNGSNIFPKNHRSLPHAALSTLLVGKLNKFDELFGNSCEKPSEGQWNDSYGNCCGNGQPRSLDDINLPQCIIVYAKSFHFQWNLSVVFFNSTEKYFVPTLAWAHTMSARRWHVKTSKSQNIAECIWQSP